jgi:uncharacterized membrane protein YvbJ
MKDCPHCLKRNTNDASYCRGCGKRLDKEPIRPLMQIKKCPSCGEENQKGAVFCRFCQYVFLRHTTPTDSQRAIEKSTIQEPVEATNQVESMFAGEGHDEHEGSNRNMVIGIIFLFIIQIVYYILTGEWLEDLY